MRWLRWKLPALLAALSVPAAAQVALYGAQPPHGSAYVRFANATGAALDVRPGFLSSVKLGSGDADRVSPYSVVEKVAGKTFPVDIRQGEQASLDFAPDSFNTVLLRDAGGGHVSATVVSDGTEFNQARARLSFYNATPDCQAGMLALAPAGTAVFSDVPPAQVRTRSVNPVQALITASCTGQRAADVMLDHMDAGGSYSVWLMLPGGKAASFITKDVTLAYKP